MPGSNLTAEARHFLEELRFAIIATINEDGSPHQTVVWYLLRGDDIVVNTARGRVKERNLRRDPRIAITVEDGYRFLTLRGTARLVDDVATAQEDIRHLAAHTRGRPIRCAWRCARRWPSSVERLETRVCTGYLGAESCAGKSRLPSQRARMRL